MKIVPFSDAAVAEAVLILKNGGVIAHATETCYGLACDLSNVDAVRKVFAIKQRSEQQPISGLFSSVDDAKMYVEWNERAEELAQQYLPGPLTMILHLRADGPTQLFPIPDQAKTIGVRISSSPVAQSLVEAFGSPLSTTSANLHSYSNPYSAEDIVGQLQDQAIQPDMIIDSGVLPQNPPSTVVNLTENEQTHRKGSISI